MIIMIIAQQDLTLSLSLCVITPTQNVFLTHCTSKYRITLLLVQHVNKEDQQQFFRWKFHLSWLNTKSRHFTIYECSAAIFDCLQWISHRTFTVWSALWPMTMFPDNCGETWLDLCITVLYTCETVHCCTLHVQGVRYEWWSQFTTMLHH